ncbi:hypothetical protein COCNU_scaffold060974G000040 [Cocos nucifera]|nr:hypothetical protein [Cocos nucifera]
MLQILRDQQWGRNEALIVGLKIARKLKVDRLQVYSDFQLVVDQVSSSYEAQEESMVRYLGKVRNLTPAFDSFGIQHIPRAENARADLLSKLATSTSTELSKEVFLETLKCPTTEKSQAVLQTEFEPSWIDPLVAYLKERILPHDRKKARKLKNQTSRYVLYEGRLYTRSYSLPLLRCLRPSEADLAP